MSDTFLKAVEAEIIRATGLFPDQERTLTLAEWFSVLTEEVGEVAREINDTPFGDNWRQHPIPLENMWLELVQVAAMAERMATAIELRQSVAVPLRRTLTGRAMEEK